MSWVQLEHKHVTVRKDHFCYLCGYKIKTGTRCIYTAGVWEGEGSFIKSRIHDVCMSMTKDWDTFDWEVHEFGCFRENYAGELYREFDEWRDL